MDDGLPSPARLLQSRILRDRLPVSVVMYTVRQYDFEAIRSKFGARQFKQKIIMITPVV